MLSSPSRNQLRRGQIGAPNSNLLVVGEDCMPGAESVMSQLRDEVAPYNGRAMQPDEFRRIEPALELADRLMQQVTVLADAKAHIVSLGFDPINITSRNAHHFGTMRDPEFLGPFA